MQKAYFAAMKNYVLSSIARIIRHFATDPLGNWYHCCESTEGGVIKKTATYSPKQVSLQLLFHFDGSFHQFLARELLALLKFKSPFIGIYNSFWV